MSDNETEVESLAACVERLGLTVVSKFVPWSLSRSYDKDGTVDKRNLNWSVTLLQNGCEVLTTDYSAGLAWCPSYKQGARWTLDYAGVIESETETGRAKGKPILPESLGVIASLAMDSDVLDYAKFEDWAEEFGYESDSRSAEKVYRACLEIALTLRAALGDRNLEALREAAREY